MPETRIVNSNPFSFPDIAVVIEGKGEYVIPGDPPIPLADRVTDATAAMLGFEQAPTVTDQQAKDVVVDLLNEVRVRDKKAKISVLPKELSWNDVKLILLASFRKGDLDPPQTETPKKPSSTRTRTTASKKSSSRT